MATIATDDPKRARGRGRRLFVRAFLGCGLLVLVLITISALLLVPKLIDEPPYVAPGLELVLEEIPAEQNAALLFMDRWQMEFPEFPEDTWYEWLEACDEGNLLKVAESDPEFLERFWLPTLELLGSLESAARLPKFQLPLLTSFDQKSPETFWLKQTADLLLMRSQILYERGEKEPLLRSLEGWGRIAGRLSQDVSSVVRLLISSALAHGYLQFLADRLSATEGDLGELLSIVQTLDFDRPDASNALRVEFQMFREVLRNPDYVPVGERGWVDKLFFLPNQTERIYGDHLLSAIAEGEATGRVAQSIELPEFDDSWSRLRRGNFVGWGVIALTAVNTLGLFQRVGDVATKCRAMHLMVAIVAYEEAQGVLPAELAQLVPTYLSELPVDPFDGQLLRYDPERRRVWGVGADGIDSGGTSQPWDKEGADIVVSIPKRGE